MAESAITAAQADGVGTIVFNRPGRRNALSLEVFGALGDYLDQWRDDDSVAAVVITGGEEMFCAGLDLVFQSGFTPESRATYAEAACGSTGPCYAVDEVQLFTAAGDGRALVLFRQRGTAPPALRPAFATSGRFEVQGCDIFLGFRDGLLSHYTASFEIAGMLQQLGALPPRGDLKGGAYLLSLPGALA